MSGTVSTCVLLLFTIVFEFVHAAFNGWVAPSHLLTLRLIPGAAFSILFWLAFFVPLIGVAAFRRNTDEYLEPLARAIPASGFGLLIGFLLWFLADYLHFFVTGPLPFLDEDFAGAAIATAVGWLLTAVVLFRKRPIEMWFVVGITAGVAWGTLTKELPAYLPLVTINGVAVCLAPGVVLLERLSRFSKWTSMGVMLTVVVAGSIAVATWDLESAAHTTLTDESVGLGAFTIGDRVGLFGESDFSLCSYREPVKVRFKERPTRNIFIVTVDALRADHVSKERFPTLFSEGFIEIPRGYSVGTKTDDSFHTLFTGRLLDSELGPMLATNLEASGYNVFAAAALSAEGESKRLGFKTNVGPERLSALRENVDPGVVKMAAERIAKTPEPVFGWVHLVAPHGWVHFVSPHRSAESAYIKEVDAVGKSVEAVLQSIQERDPNAIVIFSADHGESLGDFGLQTHAWQAWESVVRVPLFVSGFTPAEPDRKTSLLDIVPTVLDLAGATHRGFQGCSMTREDCSQPTFLQAGDGPLVLRGLIVDELKLSYDFTRRSYRMTTLDDESKNLIDEHPDKFEELRRTLSCR